MNGTVGYYVHHQGAGHRQRASAIAAAYDGSMTLIGTGLAGLSGAFSCLDLPDDRMAHGSFDGTDGTTRPPSLHYAPLHHAGLQERVAIIANWIATSRPSLMVVDVSVEVAMLARLASVPTVYVRLNGRRDDQPHRAAFASALGLLAPFAEVLEEPFTPAWVRSKTHYAPNIVYGVTPQQVDHTRVLIVVGRGGERADGARWAEAAAANPDRRWRVIGPSNTPVHLPANLEIAGWVDDAEAEIASAGVVIGAAGDGLVSTVLAHARPFICLPEPRAFDEQACKASRLAAVNAAIVLDRWPSADQWRTLIDAAERQPGKRRPVLRRRDGAEQAARWLSELVTSQRPVIEAGS